MKRFLALFLVLILTLGMFNVATAEDLKKVTLRIATSTDECNMKDDRSDAPQYILDFYEHIRHNILPGYEIEIELMMFEDREAQLPMLLAANDVPDIFISDANRFREYFPTGYFIEDLTPYLEQYGQNILKSVEARSMEICKVGDNLPAIPCENFYYKFRTIIRTDWVEKLGFEVKKVYTLSEIKEIWLAMVNNDPDGNGKKDTFGLGTRYNGGGWPQSFMPILGAFGGAIDDVYINENNEAYMFNYSDDFRDAIIWLTEMYAAGAIDDEIFVLNYDQAQIKAAKGISGTFSGWWNVVANLFNAGLLEIQPEARVEFIYITSDDGTKEGNADNGTIWKTAMISNECEYPEAAVAFIDYMHTYEGQGMGNEVLLDENGKYMTETVDGTEYYVNKVINWAKETGSTDEDVHYAAGMRLTGLNNLFNNMALRQIDQDNKIVRTMPEGGDDPAIYTTEEWRSKYIQYMNYCGDMMHNNPDGMGVYTSAFYGMPITPEEQDYMAALETQRTTWFVDFVTGVKDASDDAVWAEYLNDAVAKGAQKMLDSQCKTYNELNGTNVTTVSIVK